jgi:hypothetical protein
MPEKQWVLKRKAQLLGAHSVSAAFTEIAAIKNCTPRVPFNDIPMTITDTCVTRRSHYSSDYPSNHINVGSNYSNFLI